MVPNRYFADTPLLTLAEVASFLKIAEKTVLRMIHKGQIPCVKIATQWRFVPSQIQQWLSSGGSLVDRADAGRDELGLAIEHGNERIPISRLTDEGLIITGIAPGSRRGILEQLVSPLVQRGLIEDSAGYVEKLLNREDIISTGIGNGVAVPHVRNPMENPVSRPILVLGTCSQGCDFRSVDGSTTHLFVLLLAGSEIVHLRILARINQLFMVEGVVDRLVQAGNPREVLRELIAVEQSQGGDQ